MESVHPRSRLDQLRRNLWLVAAFLGLEIIVTAIARPIRSAPWQERGRVRRVIPVGDTRCAECHLDRHGGLLRGVPSVALAKWCRFCDGPVTSRPTSSSLRLVFAVGLCIRISASSAWSVVPQVARAEVGWQETVAREHSRMTAL